MAWRQFLPPARQPLTVENLVHQQKIVPSEGLDRLFDQSIIVITSSY